MSIDIPNGAFSTQLFLEDTIRDTKNLQWNGSEDPAIWSIEMAWSMIGSPFLNVYMEGASSSQKAVGELHLMTWRLFPSDPIVTVFLLPTFVGNATFQVRVNVKQNTRFITFSRAFEVHTSNPAVTIFEPIEDKVVGEPAEAVVPATPHRRLTSYEDINDAFVVSSALPPKQIDMWPVEMSTLQQQPLVVIIANIVGSIDGVTSMICESEVSTFDDAPSAAPEFVRSASLGEVPFVNGLKLVHTCNEPLTLTRHPAADGDAMVILQVKLKEPTAEFVSYIATLSVHWSILPVLTLPGPQVTSVGSLDVPLGATISIRIDGEELPRNTRIAINVSSCSENLTVAVISNQGAANPAIYSIINCVIQLESESSEQRLVLPIDLKLSHVTDSDAPGSIQVTTSTFQEDDGVLGSWLTISDSISTIEYQFCVLAAPNTVVLYALEHTVQEYNVTRLASLLFRRPTDYFSMRLVELTLVWPTAPEQLGTFFVNGTRLMPQKYNASAVYVVLNSSDAPNMSFLPSISNTPGIPVYFDIVLKFSKLGSVGCAVRQNARLITVSHTGEPQVALPYVYSSMVYEGAFATVNIPLIEVADQLHEFIELKIRSNVSSLRFQFEGNDSAVAVVGSNTSAANLTTVVVQRSDLQHRIERMAIQLIPMDNFVGAVQFEIEVAAIRNNVVEMDNVEQYCSEFLTIYQVVLEWFDSASFTSIEPSPLGTAMYRSMPMQLRTSVTLSFSYRLSSGTVTS